MLTFMRKNAFNAVVLGTQALSLAGTVRLMQDRDNNKPWPVYLHGCGGTYFPENVEKKAKPSQKG